ncbi:hypothetical protein P171DRAFT_445376 [Karstenula rhodostoma CBS 690.94]|uniref:Uncharacterized protein n=1 Tax=Karstenula rhodostoma CBS 690.94 TaxID=1392251 RepID=A0A9P4PGZ3_9PLEO|nr:hypothetical protein P171DRAFT_445376 [Karstenula rhodostoma CBS 690.94]
MATSQRGHTKRKAVSTGDNDLRNLANSTAASPINGSSDVDTSSPQQHRKKQRRGTDEKSINHEVVIEATELEPGNSDGDDGDEDDDGGWGDAFEDDRDREDEQDEDDDQSAPAPIPPNAPGIAAPAPVVAPAPVAPTPLQRFTALRQIYPNTPDPGTNSAAFQLFAQAKEGKRAYATHSPEDDRGSGKIVAGKRIPDYALVLIHDHLFRGLSYKACKVRYIRAGGGKAGATDVADNALSKCLKLWGPRWYDDQNLVWPWRLLAADQQRCKALRAAGLDKRYFPQSTVQQPAPVNQQPAPVQQQQASVSQQPVPVSQQAAPVNQQPAPVSQLSALVGQRKSTRLSAKTSGQEVSDEEIWDGEVSDGEVSDGEVSDGEVSDEETFGVEMSDEETFGGETSYGGTGDNDLASKLAFSGSSLNIHEYLRVAQESSGYHPNLIRLQDPNEVGSGHAWIRWDTLAKFTERYTPDVPGSSASAARVFAQCFSSAETGGPLSQLPSHEIIWDSDEDVVVVGWDDFRKLDPTTPTKIPIEWTAKRLYEQLKYAHSMRSAEHMDMVLDEWHRQYLEQSAMYRDPDELLSMLDFDIKEALSIGLVGLWGAPFRRFLLDVLKAEGMLELFITDGTHEDEEDCLQDSTQSHICERYHHHVFLHGKTCYKEQAATYAPERNLWTLYQTLFYNRNGWYPRQLYHPDRDRDWREGSTALEKEAEQAAQLLLQNRFEGLVARLAPLSDRVDPAELLMNRVEVRSIPHDVAQQYIPVVKEFIDDLALNRPWCTLLEDPFRKANLLLALLEARAGSGSRTQNGA